MTAVELELFAERLRSLTADVATASYSWQLVDVGWQRPHGELVLTGPKGLEGRGELVAFTPQEHEAFDVVDIPMGVTRVGDVPLDGFARCALEGALIDLALRQAGLCLRDLVAGVPDVVDVGLCLSFQELPDPAPASPLKIDHQPGATYDGLNVAVLDYKGLHELVELPGAVFEDPPTVCRAPWSLDQSVLRPHHVDDAADAGCTHVNLKAPRMGGFVRTIEAAAVARRRGLGVYWGGMWELGVARRQALQLAALVCPHAKNDIAPPGFRSGTATPISMAHVGFGAAPVA